MSNSRGKNYSCWISIKGGRETEFVIKSVWVDLSTSHTFPYAQKTWNESSSLSKYIIFLDPGLIFLWQLLVYGKKYSYCVLFSTAARMSFPRMKIVIVECTSTLITPQNFLYPKAKPRTYVRTSSLAAEVVSGFCSVKAFSLPKIVLQLFVHFPRCLQLRVQCLWSAGLDAKTYARDDTADNSVSLLRQVCCERSY
jgi:hypothetical protein